MWLKLERRSLIAWVLACCAAVAPMAQAEDPATSSEGHLDLLPFAVITLTAAAEDVAPFVPAGFELTEVGGQTAIFVTLGLFENGSFDFNDGTSLQDPAQFAYADVLVATSGPGGSSDGGVLPLWRLASTPIFPDALARLGVGCGGGVLLETRACHVPQLTAAMQTSAAETTIEVSVPWGFSPHTVSASFVPASLPCAAPCLTPIPAWHAGSRGVVREDVFWGSYPDTATVGVGSGTVVVSDNASPLSDMLGDPEGGQATGPAILVNAPGVLGTFVLNA